MWLLQQRIIAETHQQYRDGKNSPVVATYYPETDFQSVVDFAEQFDRNHPDYSLIGNNS